MTAGRSDRDGSEAAQEPRRAPERCLAELAQQLLGRRSRPLDEVLPAALTVAGRDLAGADRAWLLVDSLTAGAPVEVEGWCREGVADLRPPLHRDSMNIFPWVASKLVRGQVVQVSRVEDLPAAAAAERRDAAARNIGASLTIPLARETGHVGCLALECVGREKVWSEPEILLLQAAAQLLASAVSKRDVESALAHSETRFRMLAENATVLLAEFDTEGRYVYASPSFRELLGWEPEQLLGYTGRELVHPDDLEDSAASLSRAFRKKGLAHREHRLRHRDGSWRWFDNSGRAFRTPDGRLHFVSIGRDVTERHQMQEALRGQLAFERRLGALSRRLLGLRGEEVATGMRESLGELAEEVGAQRVYLLHFGSAPRGWDEYEWREPEMAEVPIFERPWATRQILAGEVLRVQDPQDLPPAAHAERRDLIERGVLSALGIPLQSNRKVIGFLGCEWTQERQSWTEGEIGRLSLVGELFASALSRHRFERALRDSQAQLLHAQKMEAVGRLAGGIAHDFNNLLTVIGGNAEWLLSQSAPADPIRRDLEEIDRATARAASLTRQLLTFSRRQVGELQPVDPAALVTRMAGMLRRVIGEHVTLEIEHEAIDGVVEVDPAQLDQVLVNLAVNAQDAMPEGGTLRICLERCQLDESAAHGAGLADAGSYVAIRVSDTGTGMDAATRERIFEPFFTTKGPDRGTGLGLSIAYSVITQSRGAIRVDSQPDRGSTFEILLPECPRSAVVASERSVGDGPGGSETILLVEDEPSVRRLMRRNLEFAGYTVVEAGDGAEALEVAEAHGGAIDLLLTDVVMPRLGGEELASRLRVSRPTLRVIFMSGHPQPRSGESIPSAHLMRKPVGRVHLLERIRARLDAPNDAEADPTADRSDAS